MKMILLIFMWLNLGMGFGYSVDFINVVVNVISKRADGSITRLSDDFTSKHHQWKFVAQNVVVAKVFEGATNAVWRIKILENTQISAKITFSDQFRQPHTSTYTLNSSATINLTFTRIVNTIKIYDHQDPVEADVWFGLKGGKDKKKRLRCDGNKMDGYDFPTLWQGNAYEYSLYLKTRNSDLLEINLGSKIFGKWCVASVDLGAHLIEPKILHSTPIPGVSHIKESIIRKNE